MSERHETILRVRAARLDIYVRGRSGDAERPLMWSAIDSYQGLMFPVRPGDLERPRRFLKRAMRWYGRHGCQIAAVEIDHERAFELAAAAVDLKLRVAWVSD
jgi:hypothetical protein